MLSEANEGQRLSLGRRNKDLDTEMRHLIEEVRANGRELPAGTR